MTTDSTHHDDSFLTDPNQRPDQERLGNYLLVREIGRGGMGIVYEAIHDLSGDRVALKTLSDTSTISYLRFKQEFRLLADLSHRNLVRLGEMVTTDTTSFFTMELLDALPLDQYWRKWKANASNEDSGHWQIDRLVELMTQLFDGLHTLHEAGFLHRDLKPSNVLVQEDGRVVIVDFGLAVALDEKSREHRERGWAGTPVYMSPEQGDGQPVGPATDWFSVGVILYELLTGGRPFDGKTHHELQVSKKSRVVPPPHAIDPSIDERWSNVCLTLLSKDPKDRPSLIDIRNRLQLAIPSYHVPLASSQIWVGRDSQLAKLDELWQRARQGRMEVVYVSGKSGRGKSSLVNRFLRDLREKYNPVLLRGRCYQNETVSYQGFDSVVDSLVTHLQEKSPQDLSGVLPYELSSLLQIFPALSAVPAIRNNRLATQRPCYDLVERRRRGIEAFCELLSRISVWEPIVLYIDDLQWGDDDTAAIMRVLQRPGWSGAILLIGTYRSEEVENNRCLNQIVQHLLPDSKRSELVQAHQIVVDRLNRDESMTLIKLLSNDVIGGVHPAEAELLIDKILRESEGDPLFIRFLAQSYCDKIRGRSEIEDIGSERINLLDLLWEQVENATQLEQQLLFTLAIAGRPLDQEDLRKCLVGPTDWIAMLRALQSKRLIRKLGDQLRVELHHDKIRESVENRILPEQSQSLAKQLAEVLEKREAKDFEFMADLLHRAGELKRSGAYFSQAADNAAKTLAFARAASFYRKAIELLTPVGVEEAKIRKRLGNALACSAKSAEAAEQYLQSAEICSAEDRSELFQLAALRLLTSGHVDQGVASLKKALESVRLGWPRSQAAAIGGLLWRLGFIRWRGLRPRVDPKSTRPSEGQDANNLHAQEKVERERLNVSWSAAAGLSVVDPLRGSYFVAEHLLRTLKQTDDNSIQRGLAAYIGHVGIGGSRSRGSVCRVLRQSRRVAGDRSHPYQRAVLLIGRGIAALLRGEWMISLRCCDRAAQKLNDPRCQDVVWELNTARTFALWALQYQGNLTELARRQPELSRIARENNDLFATLNFGTQVMTHLLLAENQPEEAWERLEADTQKLSNKGFYVQHHNDVLARTYLMIYQGDGEKAYRWISQNHARYRSSFLLSVQQIHVDFLQVYCRATLAAMAAGEHSPATWKKLNELIGKLRRQRVAWGDALADAFEACRLAIKGDRPAGIAKLRVASRRFGKLDMKLFAWGCDYYASLETSSNLTTPDSVIKNPSRFAAMLLPGFAER